MTTHLSTYHDLRAIGIIRSFVAQTGDFFGADKAEVHQLQIMAEEAAAFIINSLHPDKEKLFEIDAKVIESGLCFSFHSRGIPVDEQNIPIYDSKHPESSIEGLPFFLLENLSDAMQFKNEGNNGWVLIFEKRFRDFKPLKTVASIDKETLDACAKEKLKLSIAKPADAYEIIKLTYLTYRYSYAKSIFYYRKKLEEAIASGKIIAFIAKNSKNEIVVSSAYLRSPSCDSLAESGMLMSKPEYRKNSALLLVARRQAKFLSDNQGGLCIVYTNLVTTHTRSQRLVSHFGYFPTALKVSVHDRVEFVGIEADQKERESLLFAISVECSLEPITVFLPASHLDITKKLLQKLDNISFSTQESEPAEQISKFKIEKHNAESFAIITMETLGQDWLEKLRYNLKEVEHEKIMTTFVNIPTSTMLPVDFEDKMFKLNLFYSGIITKAKNKWELLYTVLRGQRFDFNSIELSDKKAVELKEYMYEKFKAIEKKL